MKFSEFDLDWARMRRIEFEEVCKEAYEEGRREGYKQGYKQEFLKDVVIRCLKEGMPIAKIMEITELSKDRILEIQKELNKK